MNKKTCAYIVLGTLGALFIGLFTYLNISVHGFWGGIAWTIGTFAFAWLLNKLVFTSIEWLAEADYEKRKAELAKLEAELEAECDKEFEEFKKQMDSAREMAKSGKLAGLKVEVVNGKVTATPMTKDDVKKEVAKDKKPAKKAVKKVAKKAVKTDKLHTVKKGRVVSK